MFLLKTLYYTVIISNTLDYLFQYLLQSFYYKYIFMLCEATCTRSGPFFADTCTRSVPIFVFVLHMKALSVVVTLIVNSVRFIFDSHYTGCLDLYFGQSNVLHPRLTNQVPCTSRLTNQVPCKSRLTNQVPCKSRLTNQVPRKSRLTNQVPCKSR